MTRIWIDASELEQLQARLIRWPQETEGALSWAVTRAAAVAAREMKSSAPKGFSLLTNSITVDQKSPLEAWVGPHVTYAWWVVKGRRAGGRLPPVSAILDWVRVKGLQSDGLSPRQLAWVIARQIQRRGTAPQDFITPVADSIGPRLRDWALTRLEQVLD